MELAVNLFNKGLQIDTNPMVLGNDTLTDALNATFVTMNGNEVILQNDMGNRRIDNAFLPSGYLPVGMKEYGGVIYVAAYNPLTNRGLIGSFPSPQRKININNEGGELDLNRFIDVNDKNENIIKHEYIIIPISDKMVLHTGDKFSVYSTQIKEILPYLTLPSDTVNNLFTFQIGTFNSQNEFVDISNKLKLWDIDITDNDIDDPILYYINYESGVQPYEAINDSELIRARNRMAVNTYSLKMSSPLYLKAILNHINNISYSIYGTKTLTNLKLEIEVTYYYNCIDEIGLRHFEIYFNGSPLKQGKIKNDKNNKPIFRNPTEYGEYQTTIIYTYDRKLTELTLEGTILKYIIKFPLLHNYNDSVWEDPIYIESLTKEGQIDISKLDSNTIEFKGYRYFNDMSTRTTTLEISVESYPKRGEDPLSFTTYINNGLEYNIVKRTDKVGTGTITQVFSWDNFNVQEQLEVNTAFPKVILLERGLYTFKYKAPNYGSYSLLDMGMFITTEIFNGNYIGRNTIEDWNKYYIKDTNNRVIGIKYSYDDLKNIFINNFADIKLIQLYPKLKYSVFNNVGVSNTEVGGNYIYPVSYTKKVGEYNIKESWNIENIINVSATINDPDIYPSVVDNTVTIGEVDVIETETEDNSPKITEIKRKIGDKIIEKNGDCYEYSEDLYQMGSEYIYGIKGNIIEIRDTIDNTGDVSFNLKQLKLISNISVNNAIKGALEEKVIFCEHLIIPFALFMKTHYITGDNDEYITIKSPFLQIDAQDVKYFSMRSSKELVDEQHNFLSIDFGEEGVTLNGIAPDTVVYIGDVAVDHISRYLNSEHNGNFLVGEVNRNDWITGLAPCVKNINGTFAQGYKRLWLKVNSNNYTPIFTVSGYGDDDMDYNVLYKNKEKFSEDNEINILKDIFYNIPHFYEYETGGKNLLRRIIGKNYNRTKEFEIDSNITVTILSKVKLIRSSADNIFILGNYDENKGIIDQIEFNEGKIHSSESFEEDVQNIQNAKIYCAALESNKDIKYDSYLHVRDKDGNPFDPLYVYYDDSELKKFPDSNSPQEFKKSYVADKFYVPELDSYMPELKSSKELYSSNGGDLINKYVWKYNRANYTINYTIHQSEEGKFDEEGNRILKLNTLNIFNRTTICDNKLYKSSPLGITGYWMDGVEIVGE